MKNLTEQEKSFNEIASEMKKILKSFNTLQESVHQTLIKSLAHYFKYKDNSATVLVLSQLTEVKGFARVESVAFFLSEIAGINVNYNQSANLWKVNFSKEPRSQSYPIKFTHDSSHLAICKEEQYRFWKIAPVKIVLKMYEDVSKMTSSLELSIAKGLAVDTLDLDKVELHLATMLDRVLKLKSDKKVQEYIHEFQQKALTPDPIELAIAEEFNTIES